VADAFKPIGDSEVKMDLEQLVPERYRIFFNQTSNQFKILDTWHPSIKNLKLEDNPDIPDGSPAIKTVAAEEVNALVGELIKLGWLDKLIAAKSNKGDAQEVLNTPRRPSTIELIVEKIAEIALDDSDKKEPHSSVAKEGISALKEIASKL
jgi:hypothetical protein